MKRVERNWSDGDRVDLQFPMAIRVKVWEHNRHTVSISRGPLTYSLKITERYTRHGGTDAWPAWDIFPESPWNYGLVLNEAEPAAGIRVVAKAWPADDQPFEANAAPLQLKVKARRIPEWQLDATGLVSEVQESPVRSREPEEEVTLIPMGAARLRISAFPTIGEGAAAHDWKPPERPRSPTPPSG